MQPIIKNYSIFVHAIHSRLHSFKDKINADPQMSAQEMVSLNKKYFDLIAESVDRYHHYKAGRMEFMNAAELYLSTLSTEQKEIQSQPVWKPKSQADASE